MDREAPPERLRGAGDITCNYNEESGKWESSGGFNTEPREPIRVWFDYRCVNETGGITNPDRCPGSPNCIADDALDDKKRAIIWSTFEAVASYMKSVLSVYSKGFYATRIGNPPADQPDVESLGAQFSGYGYNGDSLVLGSPRKRIIDPWVTMGGGIGDSGVIGIDLFVVVHPEPFGEGSTTLATASPKTTSRRKADFGRPLSGQVNVNVAKLPAEGQNETSGNRQFFVTVIHELNHVMSWSAGLYSSWVDKETGCRWQQMGKGSHEWTNNYGLKQRFLVSRRLNELIRERFLVDEEGKLGDLGVEIEDGGGSGTEGSHPNSRLYFTDVMQGKTYGVGWLSPVFAAGLEDSGWYDVNEAIVEPLVYMDAALHGTSVPNQNALIQPPVLSFPPDYICEEATYGVCWYDYSAKGACLLEKPDEGEIGGAPGWYNPLERSKIGTEELLDFAPLRLPGLVCQDAAGPAEQGGQTLSMYKQMHENATEDQGAGEKYGPEYVGLRASVCAISTIYTTKYGDTLPYPMPGCYRAMCGTDGKIRFILDDDRVQRCDRELQKIYSKKHIGHIKCPPAREACAWHKKFTVIGVKDAIPDRGPYDGGNLVMLRGSQFVSGQGYSTWVTGVRLVQETSKNGEDGEPIVDVIADLETIDVKDEQWLLKVDKIQNGKKLKWKPLALEFVLDDDHKKTVPREGRVFPGFYTLTGMSYAA